jgi:hypothetical protein
VVHNTVSLDGQLTGFPVDVRLYYEIASSITHDAVLTGTMPRMAAGCGVQVVGNHEEYSHRDRI